METVVKRYKNGIALELVDGYDGHRQWYESSEIETQDWCIDNFQPDWVSIDAGAHIGYYTMLFSALAPQGQVHAFEACETTRKMFSGNLARNSGKYDFSNVRLVSCALGNISGNDIPGTFWFADGTDAYGKTDTRVRMTTLDEYCVQHNMVSRLDFIKIDVDGWDLEVLEGAEQTLLKYRPFMVVEVNYALAWRNHTASDVGTLLDKVGYQHKLIDPCPGNWLCWPNK